MKIIAGHEKTNGVSRSGTDSSDGHEQAEDRSPTTPPAISRRGAATELRSMPLTACNVRRPKTPPST